MWECNYGSEPIDLKLLVLRFMKKIWIVVLAALLGVVLIGGPYFLFHVTFGPAKEYEAVADFYIEYELMEDGSQHTYFNQNTWSQLIRDDVFVDPMLQQLKQQGTEMDKESLRQSLYATMLSDTRIVTTTVKTGSPEGTIQIQQALVEAMMNFAEEQREIGEVRILHLPKEASLVIADVRTFRACMLGLVLFSVITLIAMLCYHVLDDSIHVPITFERRYHIPMAGPEGEEETEQMLRHLTQGRAVKKVELEQQITPEELAKLGEIVLLVKAGAHNGKQIEKMLSKCVKCQTTVVAGILTEADMKLIRAYENPIHPLYKKTPRT